MRVFQRIVRELIDQRVTEKLNELLDEAGLEKRVALLESAMVGRVVGVQGGIPVVCSDCGWIHGDEDDCPDPAEVIGNPPAGRDVRRLEVVP